MLAMEAGLRELYLKLHTGKQGAVAHACHPRELGMQRHPGSQGCLAYLSQKHKTEQNKKVDSARGMTPASTHTRLSTHIQERLS